MPEGPPKLKEAKILRIQLTVSIYFELHAKWREIHSLFLEKSAPSMKKFFLLTVVDVICGVMKIMLKEVSATFTVFERVESSHLLFFLRSRSISLPLRIKLC